MDEFSSALQHLVNVHKDQIHVLQQQLEVEQRVRREQQQRIEALEKTSDAARKAVEHAKKKIKQQKSVIRKLEQQRVNGGKDEYTADDPSTPALVGVGKSPLDVMSATHTLDQTCAALFESPAMVDRSKVNSSETLGRPRMVQTNPVQLEGEGLPRIHDNGEMECEEEENEGEEPEDYHRGDSVETVADQDVIIVDDEGAHNDNIIDSTHAHVNKTVDLALHKKSVSVDEESNTSLPSSLTHTLDPHNHSFEDRNEQCSNRKKVGGKLLSLRDGGSNKVKWREVSSDLASSTNSGDSLSETLPPSSPDKLGSPRCDSESTSTSSSPDQSSPSLLGASCSPIKQQRSSSSGTSQHLSSNVTQSLFAKTPVARTNVTIAPVSVVKTTPVSALKSAIPQSDSQFSLDVSQSAPLSPELCPPTTQLHKRPLPKTTTGHEIDLPSTITSQSPQNLYRSILPITPGVPSVNKILERDKKGWVMVHGFPVTSSDGATVTSDTLPSVRNVSGGKRGQDQVDFEDEDILPQSKVHRLTSMDDTAANSYYIDDDHTRLEVQEGVASPRDEEEAVYPVILCHPVPNLATAAESDNLTKTVTGEAQGGTGNGSSFVGQQQMHQQKHELLKRAGLPTGYKCDAVIRKKADRDKLEGKACPDCEAWFAKDDGIHGDVRDHLRCTCRHKHLHLPPNEDSRLWNISFPSTEECEEIMIRK